MQIFLNLKLSFKMLAGFFIVGFLLFFGTAVGVFSSYTYKESLTNVYSHYLVPATAAADFYSDAQIIQNNLFQAVQEPAIKTTLLAQAKNARETALQTLAGLAGASSGELNSSLQALQTAWGVFDRSSAGALAALETGSPTAASLAQVRQDWNQFHSIYQVYNNQIDTLADGLHQSIAANFWWVIGGLSAAGGVGIVIAILVGVFVSGTISKPVHTLAEEMQHLSRGEVRGISRIAGLIDRKDEIGDLARDLHNLRSYLVGAAAVADEIAAGNLKNEPVTQGEQDVLSNALKEMVKQLRALVEQIQTSAGSVNQGAQQVSQAAGRATDASSEVTVTFKQMAAGISHQTQDMNTAMLDLDRTSQAIDRVDGGVQAQERTLTETLQVTGQMDQSIQNVQNLVGLVTEHADASAQQARDGSGTLRQMAANMAEIQNQTTRLGDKVTTMGDYSEKIGAILETIEDIATQTNILAINAAIEAVHAETQAKKVTEEMLGQMLVAQCHMVSRLLSHNGGEVSQPEWQALCAATGLDSLLITDGDGVTLQTNDPALAGWRFPTDPNDPMAVYRRLLPQNSGVVCPELQVRGSDHQVYKTAGIARGDAPGLIQVGYNLASMQKYDLRIQGFSVVASEVYQLAEHARSSAREIRDLIRSIQGSIQEAFGAMQASQYEVQAGMNLTARARTILDQILTSAQDVQQLAQQARQASLQMQQLSGRMVAAMDSFREVVVDHTAATEEMNTSFEAISRVIAAAAGLSAENSAAVTQVLATHDAMRTEMRAVVSSAETLNQMANGLQLSVEQFSI